MVATRLRCGEIFNNHFIANSLLNQPMKEFDGVTAIINIIIIIIKLFANSIKQ